MSDSRWLIAGIAVIAGLYFSASTLGYEATTADRTVSVDVVGDEDAYLALSYPDRTISVDPNTEETLVNVENRFVQPVEISLTAVAHAGRGLSVDVPSIDGQLLTVGDRFTVPMSLTCTGRRNETHTATVSFEVRADGESVSMETSASRTVTYSVVCPGPGEPPTDTETANQAVQNA
ncbi:hypothetical protein SVXHr_1357 [Halorhabdus sp. SVX81]|uniref:hypothetical protein n=1 Tax=Halorhabdus sp. SVX81 TaxID=2978283 RepID=UPI0023DAC0EE|nr:hypothetical protein [Halorhabdus sp. SVX81]WEL17526.1 hypothetical protein SVXHr_1357 [Halorhabdus sp. SVX81]